jgi:hypothetical protein
VSSRIPELGDKLTKLPIVLAEYEEALEEAVDALRIKGKKLEKANIENASWQHYFDNKRIELNTLLKFVDSQVQSARGRLFQKYKENYSRELNEREINRYIDNEQKYLTVNELKLEVQEMYEKYNAVVEAFRSRGYALNNITRVRCASLEDVEL